MQSKTSFLVGALALALSACNSSTPSPVALEFGSLYDSSLSFQENTRNLGYSSFNGMLDQKESFVLLVGDVASTCTCFVSFKGVLQEYLKNTNLLLYTIKPSEFDGDGKDVGSLKVSSANGYETVAIYENGSLKFQNQRQGESDAWASDYVTFATWLKARIHRSSMLYVNKNQLDKLGENNDHYVLIFSRASCPDCSYVFSHLVKAFNAGDYNTSYVFDCDVKGVRYDAAGNYDAALWQAFKDAYGLSTLNDADWGYESGRVPMAQFISNGTIEDAAIYVNDVLTKKTDGSYAVSQSYWNGTSHNFFASLPANTVADFTSLSIPASDVDDGSWKYEAAAKYHDPLFKGFLTYYLSKN